MASRKRGLGRGLSALIPDESEGYIFDEDAKKEKIVEIDVNLVVSNKDQPRKEFEKESLEELRDSIKKYGIIQPIVVRKISGKYEIIAGERRWRAAKEANLDKVPCIIKEVDDMEAIKIALIENIQRQDLNPIEEANAFKALMDNFSLTQEEVAEAVGKSRSYIANTIRLLNLDKEILDYVSQGKISAGHGKALLSVKNKKERLDIAKAIVDKNLNVRDTEKLVSRSKSKKIKEKVSQKDPFVEEVEEKLMSALGTKVNLIPGKKGGRIEIEFYNDEDLQRIVEIIANEQ
ncbi:MAG TPA: ParB/RepB/Spo0J family partition protein [Tissierellia bacterium]|nr:ParB/RepB/Spo0J family partition protein [Tissierellia bacterium]